MHISLVKRISSKRKK